MNEESKLVERVIGFDAYPDSFTAAILRSVVLGFPSSAASPHSCKKLRFQVSGLIPCLIRDDVDGGGGQSENPDALPRQNTFNFTLLCIVARNITTTLSRPARSGSDAVVLAGRWLA